MAKSITLLNKEIADSLRFQSLMKPPETIELTKLSRDIDSILKQPPNFLQSGPMLDDYYGKLIKFMKLLKNVNQSSYPQSKISKIESHSESQQTEDFSDDDDDAAGADSSVQVPANLLTPQRPPVQTKQSSPHEAALNSISVMLKRDLLIKIADKDKHFSYDPSRKKLIIRGKPYSMNEFNNLYSQLRSPNKKINEAKMEDSEKELLNVVKETLENTLDGQTIIKKLPGLETVIVSQPVDTVTRKKAGRRKAAQQSRISSNSPVSSRSAVKNQKAKRSSLKKIGGGRKTSKPPSKGKIHFKRWNTFIK